MKCSYSDCQQEFYSYDEVGDPENPKKEMGFIFHIYDNIAGKVMWGSYCNADCALADIGPMLLARAEADAAQAEEQPATETYVNKMRWDNAFQRAIALAEALSLQLGVAANHDSVPWHLPGGYTTDRYMGNVPLDSAKDMRIRLESNGDGVCIIYKNILLEDGFVSTEEISDTDNLMVVVHAIHSLLNNVFNGSVQAVDAF